MSVLTYPIFLTSKDSVWQVAHVSGDLYQNVGAISMLTASKDSNGWRVRRSTRDNLLDSCFAGPCQERPMFTLILDRSWMIEFAIVVDSQQNMA